MQHWYGESHRIGQPLESRSSSTPNNHLGLLICRQQSIRKQGKNTVLIELGGGAVVAKVIRKEWPVDNEVQTQSGL
jgi:hypothetical protein